MKKLKSLDEIIPSIRLVAKNKIYNFSMKVFICINDLSKVNKEDYDPEKIIYKKILNQEILGIFFYSNSVKDLAISSKSDKWLSFVKTKNIPIFACINSLSSRSLIGKIDPKIKITGLGQLIEGVLLSDKTEVIGRI